MAVHLIFRAMAEKGYGSSFGQVLQESQGEFLAVVLDAAVPLVNRAPFAQLF